MLLTKLVVRIMDVNEVLLGWAEVEGEARGDGKIWVAEPTHVFVEREGDTRYLSVHWCDVNVEIRSLVDPMRVKVGEMFHLAGNWAAIMCGPPAGGLPPVTVSRPVSVNVPVGALGARSI